jgi:hypothetical protein
VKQQKSSLLVLLRIWTTTVALAQTRRMAKVPTLLNIFQVPKVKDGGHIRMQPLQARRPLVQGPLDERMVGRAMLVSAFQMTKMMTMMYGLE